MTGHALLVLMVERNPAVIDLARHFLERYGFRTAFAEDGLAALSMAVELRPDVLITEILVPRMDGLAVCRQLKAHELTRAIKVVVFSVLHARERALAAGADAFLLKPVQEDRLLETVQQLLAIDG
ncbi:MAG: response regulator [bacterium]|nr:response regulator [bacterium]